MLSKTVLAIAFTAASVAAGTVKGRRGTGEQNSPDFIGDVMFPVNSYHYDSGSGTVSCNLEDGLIEKYPADGGNDISTLFTFVYPESAAGRQCQFQFFLSKDSDVSGSEKLDVFTTISPAQGCSNSWNPGSGRNLSIGRLAAQVGGNATWVEEYGTYLTQPTDCRAPGTVEGFELVGVYDYDFVSWGSSDGSGPQIIIS